MAYIRYVSEEDAPPELKATYDRLRQKAGHVANILRIHGLNPPITKQLLSVTRTSP